MTSVWMLVAMAAASSAPPIAEYRATVKAGGELWLTSARTIVVQDAAVLRELSDEKRRANVERIDLIRNGVRIPVPRDAEKRFDFSNVKDGDVMVAFPLASQHLRKDSPWPQREFPSSLDDVVFGLRVHVSVDWPRDMPCRLVSPEGRVVTPLVTGDSAHAEVTFTHTSGRVVSFSCVPSWDAVREKLNQSVQIPDDLAKALTERKSKVPTPQRVDETRMAVNSLKFDRVGRATAFVEALRVAGVEATVVHVPLQSRLVEQLPWLPKDTEPVVYVDGISQWFESADGITPLCSAPLLSRQGIALSGSAALRETGAGTAECATFTSEATLRWNEGGHASWQEKISTSGPCSEPIELFREAAARRDQLGAAASTRDGTSEFTLKGLPAQQLRGWFVSIPAVEREEHCRQPLVDDLLKSTGAVAVGSPRTVRSIVHVEVPEGFDVDAPKSLTGEGPGVRWAQTVTRDERRVDIERSITFATSSISSADQPEFARALTSWKALQPLRLEDAAIIAARKNVSDGAVVARRNGPMSLARLAAWAGLYEFAAKNAREAAQQNPNSSLAWKLVANSAGVDSFGGSNDVTANIEALEKAMAADPTDQDSRVSWLIFRSSATAADRSAVNRVLDDPTFSAKPLRLLVAEWLLAYVHDTSAFSPAKRAAIEKWQKEATERPASELADLRRYDDGKLKRHEAIPFSPRDARDVAIEVLAHRYKLMTRVPAAKVGVTARLPDPKQRLNDAALDTLRTVDAVEKQFGKTDTLIKLATNRPDGAMYRVLLEKNGNDWRASPRMEPLNALNTVATALDGNDVDKLRDAVELLIAAAGRLGRPVDSLEAPALAIGALTFIAELVPNAPNASWRARIAKWDHFGDGARVQLAKLQHAWGFHDDARRTAERAPADDALNFALAMQRGDFKFARELQKRRAAQRDDPWDVIESAELASWLGDEKALAPLRELARTKFSDKERAYVLNTIAWNSFMTNDASWTEALRDAQVALELAPTEPAIIGTWLVLEAAVGDVEKVRQGVTRYWDSNPPPAMSPQFIVLTQALVAERLGFTDEAKRLYAGIKPLSPVDVVNDVAPIAKKRLKKL